MPDLYLQALMHGELVKKKTYKNETKQIEMEVEQHINNYVDSLKLNKILLTANCCPLDKNAKK